MYYIHTISSITHQNTFRTENICENLTKLTEESELISPDYKEFIPPTSLRRLSPVLRIGLTTSIECKSKMGKDFDAISVGTALGCLRDTEKFLNTIHTTTSDVLSPTAFIQSTHNTIGGQISLGLKNHAYNMTHTQNSLSFEVAFLDGMMCIHEGKSNVLVGAADEKIGFLENVQPQLIPNKHPLTSGASFFAISDEVSESRIGVRGVYVNFASERVSSEISQFLSNKHLSIHDIDLVLHNGNESGVDFLGTPELNYLDYSGMHYSASAFALHIAHDKLAQSGNMALIINDLCPGNLGLMLVEKR